MPEFEAPVTGRFCWVELQTKDLAGAKQFYGELMGWTFDDLPATGVPYTVAKHNGKLVAGLIVLPDPAAPAQWASYVAVDDVAASTAVAAKLGATILLPATRFGTGTFAVIADPTGASLLLWHTTQPMGSFLYGETGSLTWNELITTNADVAQGFYRKLFGWKAEPWDMPETAYTVLKAGEFPVGGLMAQPAAMAGAPSAWFTYFAVEDADATFAAATRRGAKVLMPLRDVPDVGRFGFLADPQGVPFAVVKNAPTG